MNMERKFFIGVPSVDGVVSHLKHGSAPTPIKSRICCQRIAFLSRRYPFHSQGDIFALQLLLIASVLSPRYVYEFGEDRTLGVDMHDHVNLLERTDDIRDLITAVRRIAVLGIKTEQQSSQPAFYVPQYLDRAGFDVIPVPVYYPDVTEILGKPVYRRLADIPGTLDLVNVFRRPQDIEAHLDDMLAAKPAAVWFQSGIRHEAVADTLARAGIKVVQDRCLMVEHRSL